ncbi:LLM class flavin-dependent oxidoreductase [Hyphomicrobium sp. CS1BSMeth3]|uniref:LLM class flavin-dependent oxidoreductase n=1 Tax=Hyphomicrobium sp. CS1BSMeth3 TaxID=1892844 RepID=UPI000931F79D|nr:LLM class flavin-dependent oxidoreductase [Hyphomicrobium sp. CS1BSMeth3]
MKEIRLNAFVMNSVTHSHQGLWRHPRDHSLDYTNLEYWIEFAKLLERGKFDGIFMADGLGVYDVYGGSPEAAIRSGVMIPKNDPSLLVSAMAAATKHLGFGITFSVTDEVPYSFARKISTLDHITNGRIGWNIVTGFLESAAKAKGDERMIGHDERYVIAEEFMDVVYRLWEQSWEDDAVLRDVENGIYADPSKVHRIQHDGKYFKLDAVHMSEPSPQRTPVLYQAGTSSKGVEFAGRHAECVFINGPRPSVVGGRVKKIREAAVEQGRSPHDIQTLMSINVIAAPTDSEAEAKHAEYSRYIDPEGSLVRLSGFIGTDLSKLDLNGPIKSISTNSIQSILENLTKGNPERPWTVADVANSLDRDGVQPIVVGSPKTVADELERWVVEADVDGFNLIVPIKPESMSDFVELVVPELQRRGMFKKEYGTGTLRDKLYGKGAKTPANHPSAKVRIR